MINMKRGGDYTDLRPTSMQKIKSDRLRRFEKIIFKNKRAKFMLICAAILLAIGALTFPEDAIIKGIYPKANEAFIWEVHKMWIITFLTFLSLSAIPVSIIAKYRSRRYIYDEKGSRIDSISKDIKIIPSLPKFPETYNTLQVTLGEVHEFLMGDPVEKPDWLTISEQTLYTNIFAVGGTGSGKTEAVLKPILYQLMDYQHDKPENKAALFSMDVKGDFYENLTKCAETYGREKDLVILEPKEKPDWLYNPLNYPQLESKIIAGRMAEMVNILSSSGGGNSNDKYWDDLRMGFLTSGVDLFRLLSLNEATKEDLDNIEIYDNRFGTGILPKAYFTFIDFQNLLNSDTVLYYYLNGTKDKEGTRKRGAPASPAPTQNEINDLPFTLPQGIEGIKKTYKDLTDQGAFDNSQHRMLKDRFESCIAYFEQNYLKFKAEGDREFQIMKSMVAQVTDIFGQPILRPIFCPTIEDIEREGRDKLINFDDIIDKGMMFILVMPEAKYESAGRQIAAAIRLDFFSSALLRISRKDKINQTRPIIYMVDEYQVYVTPKDAEFFSRSRQSKVIGVIATQTYPAFLKEMDEKAVKTLLGNFMTKIALRNLDADTSEFVSKMTPQIEVQTASESYSDADKEGATMSESLSTQKQQMFESTVLSTLNKFEAIYITAGAGEGTTARRFFTKPWYLRKDVDYFTLGKHNAEIAESRERGSAMKYYELPQAPEWTLAKHEGNKTIYSTNPYVRAVFQAIISVFPKLRAVFEKI